MRRQRQIRGGAGKTSQANYPKPFDRSYESLEQSPAEKAFVEDEPKRRKKKHRHHRQTGRFESQFNRQSRVGVPKTSSTRSTCQAGNNK